MKEDKIKRAEECLGIKFYNSNLLKQALTHRSLLADTKTSDNIRIYERLEFLGDALLNFVVTDFLFHRFPQFDEGDLAKLRANLVNAGVLAKVARRIGLGKCMFMSKGVEQEGGRERISILGDCFEAVAGAVYLDQGTEVAREFVLINLRDEIFKEAEKEEFSDFKTALQEYAVSKFDLVPDYKITTEKGPMHRRLFFAEVKIKGKVWGRGKGSSKKRAELAAAEQALKALREKYG